MNHRPSPFNPFPGLRPFEMQDRIVFFGREEQTADLLKRLRLSRFLAVVGSSGSGKSSLVRAGLLPGLHGGFMAGAGSHWMIATMRPGGDPIGNLATALVHAGLVDDLADPFAFVRSTLARSALGLIECVQQSRLRSDQNLLVVVDQFEEIFRFRRRFRTLEEEAGDFVRVLLEAAQQQVRSIFVVLTMRSDFIGECSAFQGLPQALNHGQYLVPRMSRDQARRAIEGPVQVADGRIAGRLVQRLLNDLAADAEQLPVLQHTLMRMWDLWVREADFTQPLDLGHYEAVGTMAQALSRHLDEAYHELHPGRDRWLAERLFKALTELAPDNRGVRRPTRLQELCEIIPAERDELTAVIDRFRQPGRTFLMPPMARLVAALPTGNGVDESGVEVSDTVRSGSEEYRAEVIAPPQLNLEPATVIDISHESLMRVWTRLQQWVREETASGAIYRRLADSARLHRLGEAGLYRDPELQIALTWRRDQRPTAAWAARYMPDFEQTLAYLEESATMRDSARRAEARHRRMVIGVLSVIILVFFGLWQYARSRQQIATSRLLALRADNILGLDPAKAILFATRAVKTRITERAAQTALRKAVLGSRLRQDDWGPSAASIPLSSEGVGQASFDASDAQILWATGSNTFVIVSGTDRPVRTLNAHDDLNRVALFSPSGSLALTAGWDQRAILWDPNHWARLATLEGHSGAISRAAFSRDGQHVATASRDRTVRVWEVPGGSAQSVLRSGETPADEVTSVAFANDGNRIALGTRGGNLSVWSWPETNRLWIATNTSAGAIFDVQFISEDSVLLSASEDGLVRVWESKPGGSWEIQRQLSGHSGRIHRIAVSPDGEFVATAGQDRTYGSVVLWDLETGTALYTNRHPDSVRSVDFSHDGRLLLTACDDGRLRTWDVGIRKLAPAFSPQGVRWAQATPDGKSVIVGDGSPRIRIHRLSDGGLVTQQVAHASGVLAAAIEPRAGLLATIGAEISGSLRVWDLRTWNPNASVDLEARPQSLAFSPDGRLLVITHDARITILDVATWSSVRVLNQQHVSLVLQAAFSSDGSRLVTAGEDRMAIVWDTRSWRESARLLDHRGPVHAAVFAPQDRNRLVTASDTVRFYRYTSGEWGRPIEAQGEHRHVGDVRSVLYSTDGSCVISCGEDGQVLVWNVMSGEFIGALARVDRSSPCIALFDPEGIKLFTLGTSLFSYECSAWAPRGQLMSDVDPARRPLRPLSTEELGP